MRLLIGLILWVGTPFYWAQAVSNPANFNAGVGLVMAFLAVGMAIGEYSRYQRRARRDAAEKAQAAAWLRK